MIDASFWEPVGVKDRSMADRSFEAIVATTVLGVKIFQPEQSW